MLLAGRFLQGVGAALILPSTLSIVNATFRGRERAIAFGIWGATIGGMAALGPLAGGWFVTHLSWRWAFYVNVPIAAVALAGAVLYVDESRDPDARPGFDPAGVVLSTLGFLGIVFGLIEGQTYGWWTEKRDFLGLAPFAHSVIPFAFAVGAVSLAAFVVVERVACASRSAGARRLRALPDPELPLRQRGGADRRARRVRPRLRHPALPPVGARPDGVRYGGRAGRARWRGVRRRRLRRAAHPSVGAAPRSFSSGSRSRSSASSPSASPSRPTGPPGSSARSCSSTGSALASPPHS